MDRSTFDKVITDQLSRSELLLTSKGHEYAENAEAGTGVDRLDHFKKAAALQGETPAQATFGMLAKHLVSIADMVGTGKDYAMETWDEKITDSINYLLILRAVVSEGRIA